jgi:tetratricopeptide (TPR) repeat protein
LADQFDPGKEIQEDTELKIKLLEEDLAARERAAHLYAEENKGLKEQARRADKRSPEVALVEAAAAREQGNWTPADYRIEQWFDLEGQSVAQIMLDRSQWALLRARGDELRIPGMVTAHAFASAALLLAPGNKAAAERINELLQWCQHEGITLVPFRPDMLEKLRSEGQRLNFDALANGVALFAIAQRLYDRGLYSLSLDCLQRAVGLLRSELGENNLKTLDAHELRARVFRWLGKYEAARHEIENVILKKAQNKSLGSEHPDTLASRNFHAFVLDVLGEYETARTEIEEVINKQESHPSLGPYHPATLDSRYIHAFILRNLGEFEAARKEIEGVIGKQGAHSSLGPDHPTTLNSRYIHANILHDLGENEAARIEVEEVISEQERYTSFGPDHPITLSSRYLHAAILRDLGKAEAARLEIEQIISKKERHASFGPDHPDTLASQHVHAVILYDLGEVEAARAEIEEVIAKQERHPSLGPNHPHTLTSRKQLDAFIEKS